MGELREINPRGQRQKRIRRIVGRAIRSALSGEVAGFALVTWNSRGDAHTAYCTDSGPIGHRLMPSFVGDALSQHVSVTLAQESGASKIDGE